MVLYRGSLTVKLGFSSKNFHQKCHFLASKVPKMTIFCQKKWFFSVFCKDQPFFLSNTHFLALRLLLNWFLGLFGAETAKNAKILILSWTPGFLRFFTFVNFYMFFNLKSVKWVVKVTSTLHLWRFVGKFPFSACVGPLCTLGPDAEI